MEQRNIVDRIKERYSQADLGTVTSPDALRPCDMRRLALELGFALFAVILLEIITQNLMYDMLRLIADSGVSLSEAGSTAIIYAASSVISYLPKVLAFGLLYAKYRVLNGIYAPYRNKVYYPVILLPALFVFGMWGSQITKLINLVLQLCFGAGEIQNIMEATAPKGFESAVVSMIFSSFCAPVVEEIIYRGLLLRSLRVLGDTPAIILSALIFGLAHGNFDQFAYSFMCGLIFAVTAVRYNSIVPTVILHIINNYFVTAITYTDTLAQGNELWNSFITASASVGTAIINFSYYAGPLTAILFAFCGVLKMRPVTGAGYREKLCTVFCPVLIAALFVMLVMFK